MSTVQFTVLIKRELIAVLLVSAKVVIELQFKVLE